MAAKCHGCKSDYLVPSNEPDGLPGVQYVRCPSCGHVEAVRRRPRVTMGQRSRKRGKS